MNLGIENVTNDIVVDGAQYELRQEEVSPYIKRISFEELKTKKIARTYVALIGSALIALSQLPIKKKERPLAEIKPSQINAHIQNSYRHKTFPIICLGDLAEQLRNKNEKS